MKNHYTLVRMFLAVALTANCIASTAQHTVEYLNANNVNAGFGIGGNLFTVFDSAHIGQPPQIQPLLEVPKGLGAKPIYTASLWMSALDTAGNLNGAAQRYQSPGPDFYDGPISSNYDSLYDNFYKRVFKITRTQIAHHQSLGNVVIPTVIDTAVLFWPAKGNAYVANNFGVTISSHLAPFVDVNSNGIYDPNHGDYPDVCGEEAVFFVFNDDRAAHLESGCDKLGFEIRGLAEVFVDYISTNTFEKNAINNTVFVSYEIENKSQSNYSDFYLAMFEDPDLGCFSNDRAGCDTNRSIMFVYNGSVPDPNCQGVTGYGQNRVASGTKFLHGDLDVFGYFSNGGFVEPTGTGCSDYRKYVQGLWKDSTHFTEGGSGYGGTIPTNYIFPGDPNNPNDWSEMQPATASTLPAGDRRMFGSTAQGTFAAGETKHFDFAFTTSYDSTATNLTIIDTLKRDADIVQSFYNNSILACRATHQIPLGVADANKQTLDVRVFPNPASTLLFIETANPVDAIELTDMLGRTVATKTPDAKKFSVDVSSLSRGVYLLRIKAGEQTAVKKIVVGQ